MIHRKRIIAVICICLTILLGCSNQEQPFGVGGAQPTGAYQLDENGNLHYVDPVASLPSMDLAMEKIQEYLEAADPQWDWVLRDYYYYNKEKLPAQWLFGVNEYGDYLDVVILGITQEEMDVVWDTECGVMEARKNEQLSYYRAWHYPPEFIGASMFSRSGKDESDHEFTIMYAGSDLAYYDIKNYNYDLEPNAKGEAYWDGQGWQHSKERPASMNVPIDYNADPGEFGEYKTYKPAESLEEELTAMQQRLADTGLGYEWKMQDSITVDGKEYAVTWMYAVNDSGEWVDVVFTEDSELTYLLAQYPEIFTELRKDQVNVRNQLNPERIQHPDAEHYAYRHEWLIQDCFYHGYYFYMNGDPLAIMDTGCLLQSTAWSDEYQDYATHLSREGILYKNVPPANVFID